MKQWLIKLIISIAILAGLVITLFLTPLGLKTALVLAAKFSPVDIHYRHVSGLIIGPIKIEDLKIRYKNITLSTDSLYLQWQLKDLLFKKLTIDKLEANHVHVSIQKTKNHTAEQSAASTPRPTQSTHHSFPLAIYINHGDFKQIALQINHYPLLSFKDIHFQTHIDSQQLNINISSDLTKPLSLHHDLQVTGSPSHYSIKLDARNPLSNVHITGHGDRHQLELATHDSTLAHGPLKTTLQLTWQPTLAWQWHAVGQRIQLNQLHPHWPKTINFNITTQGQLSKGHPQFSLTTDLKTPLSTLNISGGLKQSWQLKWSLKSSHLGELLPNSSGQITSTGSVQGPLTQPRIISTLNAHQLELNHYYVGSLQGHNDIDLNPRYPSSLTVIARDLSAFNHKLSQFNLQASGTLNAIRLRTTLTAQHTLITLQSLIKRHQSQWLNHLTTLTIQSPHYGHWQLSKPSQQPFSKHSVQIQGLCLRSTDKLHGTLCLNAHWQAKAPWTVSIQGKKINSHPLTLHLLPPGTSTSGAVSFHSEISGFKTTVRQASLNVTDAGGSLSNLFHGHNQTYPFKKLNLNATYQQHTLHSALTININKQDYLRATVTLPHHLTLGDFDQDQAIDGQLALNLSNLDMFSSIIPNVDISKGGLVGQLKIGGTLKRPTTNGNINLKQTNLTLPKYGITLTNISAAITAEKYAAHYKITAYSKDQPLTLSGSTQFTQSDWPTQISVSGKHILIMNTPEYTLYASPQLTIHIAHKIVQIKGDITLPKANIQPHKVKNLVTLPTEDIVYTGRRNKASSTEWQLTSHIKVHLGDTVRINILGIVGQLTGDIVIDKKPQQNALANGQIYIKNGLFEGLGHTLNIQPNSVITFTNSPITNPNLNLIATKHLNITNSLSGQYSDINDIVVGIKLTGTITDNIITLFSQPATLSQSDILMALILGHIKSQPLMSTASPTTPGASKTQQSDADLLIHLFDTIKIGETGLFTKSSGFTDAIQRGLKLNELGIESDTTFDAIGNPLNQQNSFVVGKFITKKLYMRYSRGLIDSSSLVQLRYFLTPRWILQTNATQTNATSLDNGNGIDILYRVEKD